jgi:hypothetical protein
MTSEQVKPFSEGKRWKVSDHHSSFSLFTIDFGTIDYKTKEVTSKNQ